MDTIDYTKYGASAPVAEDQSSSAGSVVNTNASAPSAAIDYTKYGAPAPVNANPKLNQVNPSAATEKVSGSTPAFSLGDLDPFNFPQDKVTRAENEALLMGAAGPAVEAGTAALSGAAGLFDTAPLSKLAQYANAGINKLGNFGAGTGMTTAFSELDPNNKNSFLQNLGENAAGNALIESAGPAIGLLGKAYSYAQPGQYAESILKNITGGQTLADNAKIFAQKIQNAYNIAKSKSSELYNGVFGDPRVISNGLHASLDDYQNYLKTSQPASDFYNSKLQDLHDTFLADPTPINAHNLQSQLGHEIRTMPAISIADKLIKDKFQQAQGALKQELGNNLNAISPDLKSQYDAASSFHLNNVVPYTDNAKIENIVSKSPDELTGKDVHNISTEFKNPNVDMQKIAQDIGPSINNHILTDQLGKLSGNVTPDKLTNAITKLKNEGYDSSVTPDLENALSSLAMRSKVKLGLQAAPGALAALKFGSLGHGVQGDLLAGALPFASIGLSKAANSLGIKNNLPPEAKNALLNIGKQAARSALVNKVSNQ